ncbi:hypothetical protein L198_06227 [Cryptococcus wingfieldii CBS 7118]|uniref:HMG box domain-containing protein n=1 Tax=Cryptococcus wingfieldii CBS 7118 TaxID=1295528 RepID=A0A1E3INN1_9TREE|nr:hypothetical protein L198_06227 [Cryptococcus wingfieldii CBS 7118]ODN90209.1 hypothetical protein L198_06227 [Cryptococcus wingfieldii CBS 7118]
MSPKTSAPKRTSQTAQDFDPDTFLQSCASLMSKRQTRASSHVSVPIPIPASEHTPPYSDGEESDQQPPAAPGKPKQHPRRYFPESTQKNALHYIMAESKNNNSARELVSPSPEAPSPEGSGSEPVPATSSAPAPPKATPMRPSASGSSPPAPPYTHIPPRTYPSSYPQTSSSPSQWTAHHPTNALLPPPLPTHRAPAAHSAASPEWQSTDAEPEHGLTTDDDGPSSGAGKNTKTEKEAIIPRPPNAWIIYPEMREGKAGKGLPQADVSKVISYLWKHETKENKSHYERQAAIRKEEHALKYPNYKFKPVSKDLKIKARENAKRERELEKRRKKEERQSEKTRSRARRHIGLTTRGHSRHSPMSPYDASGRYNAHNAQAGLGPLSAAGRYLVYGEPYPGSHEEVSPPSSYFGSSVESSSGYMMSHPEDEYRPFPLPAYAMPAMARPEGVEPPLAPAPGMAIAQEYMWHHAPPPPPAHSAPTPASAPAPRRAVPEMLAPPMEFQSSSDSLAQPPSPRTVPRDEEEDAFQRALVSINVEGMDAYQRPMAVLEMDEIPALDDAFFQEGDDINALAEKWHELGPEEGEEYERTSGLVMDEKNLDPMPAVFYELLPPDNGFYPTLPELSGAFTDPAPTSFHIAPPPEDPSLPQFAPAHHTYGFVPQIHPDDSIRFGSLYEQHPEYYRSDEYPEGPTLAGEMPMSPSEASAGATPRETTFAGAGHDTNRMPSFSHTVRTVSTASPAPRLASLSDFPLTPNSLDHIGLPFVDRSTSFAGAQFMSMNYGPMGMGMGDDFGEDDWYGDEKRKDEMAARESVFVTRRDSEMSAVDAGAGAGIPSPPASQH